MPGIAVSGSSGLVGTALVNALTAGGASVTRLGRSFAPGDFDGIDAVVHLAGENIAGRRWSAAQKQRIRDSRVLGTRSLAETLGGLDSPPRVLVCASAIGFYGSRGDELLDESSRPGDGFLPETCVEWESASAAAEQAGIRVVRLRIGLVLAAEGGALPRMLTPFKLGLGGRVGDGRQYMSWIALEDLVAVVRRALDDDALAGALNAVAPGPVTNAEFTAVLGRVLRRPTLFPLPAFVVSLLFGEMGRELLLGSTRVVPRRLVDAGFRFRCPDLEAALRLATMAG
jgi:uncharacterized protein (TIGR01777 family)